MNTEKMTEKEKSIYTQGMMAMASMLSDEFCTEHKILWDCMRDAITSKDLRATDTLNSQLIELDRVLEILNRNTKRVLEEESE